MSYQLGAVLGGGLSPVIAAALLGLTADHASWPVSLCLVAIGETITAREPSPAPAEP